MVIMFYSFASFKQIWITKYTDFVEATIESGGGGGGQKIIRVETNYSSLDRVSLGLLQKDKWCLQCLFHLFPFCESQTNIIF